MTDKLLLDTLEMLGCIEVVERFEYLAGNSTYHIKTKTGDTIKVYFAPKTNEVEGIDSFTKQSYREEIKKAPRN